MTEVLQANIFFFIASVATVLFTILLCLVLYQVLKVVKSVRRMVERVEAGSEMLAEDVEHFRDFVMQGSLVSQIIKFFMGNGRAKRRSRKVEE